MLRYLALTLTVLVIGCSSASEPMTRLAVATERVDYAPGDSVLVRFANIGAEDLLYNACYALLERRSTGGAWERIGPASGTVPCLSSLRRLTVATADSVRFGLMPDLSLGVYRYVFTTFATVSRIDLSTAELLTNPFQVR